MSTGSPTLDLQRATAVLKVAEKNKIYPEGSIPEGETDRLIEAEKIIELARQSKVIADQIGADNVPAYQAYVDILFEGQVTLGIGSEEEEKQFLDANQQATDAASAQEQSVGEMHLLAKPDTNELFFDHIGCDGGRSRMMYPLDDIDPNGYMDMSVECGECALQVPVTQVSVEPKTKCNDQDPTRPMQTCERDPGHSGMHMGGGQMWDSFLAKPAAELPSAPPESPAQPEEFTKENGDWWGDENGNPWLVVQGGGGPQVSVKNEAGLQTVVPSSFLKKLIHREPREKESSSSSTSSLQSSAPLQPEVSSPSSITSPQPSHEVSEPSPGEPSGVELPEDPQPSASPQDSSQSSSSSEIVDDAENDEDYRKVLDEVEMLFQPRAMPVPQDLTTPPAGMPESEENIGPTENRRLHMQFNALAARARYLYKMEDAKARGCERIRKRYMKQAMRESREELGKDASVTEVTHLAESFDSVVLWDERVKRHSDRADAYKTFFDLYTENVTVLSRDFTMLDLEHRGS